MSKSTVAIRCGAQKLGAKTNSGRFHARLHFELVHVLIGLLSYICGVNIKDYRHFGPGYCPLHDNEVPLHIRHEREVREAEDEAVALLRAKHPEIPEAEFRGTKEGKE